jgi:hypothetical protein
MARIAITRRPSSEPTFFVCAKRGCSSPASIYACSKKQLRSQPRGRFFPRLVYLRLVHLPLNLLPDVPWRTRRGPLSWSEDCTYVTLQVSVIQPLSVMAFWILCRIATGAVLTNGDMRVRHTLDFLHCRPRQSIVRSATRKLTMTTRSFIRL